VDAHTLRKPNVKIVQKRNRIIYIQQYSISTHTLTEEAKTTMLAAKRRYHWAVLGVVSETSRTLASRARLPEIQKAAMNAAQLEK
jgi:hypothetical protein